jgi:glycosyltransferase involved in cell wall biosynthesis
MEKISAVINTRNEEKNIENCIKSVLWCDEVVVVDMESEDSTINLVRAYTQKIYSHKKVAQFDIARKMAIEKASFEWVLLVDADELVPRTLKEKLIEIANFGKCDAVYIPRKNYFFGTWIKNGRLWPDHVVRFFRKKSVIVSPQVHNFLHFPKDARIINLPPREDFAFIHFAYHNPSQFLEKLNRYTDLEVEHVLSEGIHLSFRQAIGKMGKEFISRYIRHKAYKNGIIGLFLSISYGPFYYFLLYVKLWVAYRNSNRSVEDIYHEIKQAVINEQKRKA